ncbi:MAG: hypothetical protein M3N47_08935 [Chloroflexota bacterium]|nr:hypothetical protein [Chloroflexota bacterium]
MERVIRVLDLQPGPGNGKFFLDLHEVLPAFVPDGHAWRWAIRSQPELSAAPRWDLNLPFILEEIEKSPRGFTMSFEELEQFAARVDQVVWGEFVAAEFEGDLPTRAATSADVGRHAIAGALAFDSSYWFLGGPAYVIQRATTMFRETEDAAPEEWPATD